MTTPNTTPDTPGEALAEYVGAARVFLIDDGERHHYAAEGPWQALRAHREDYDCDCDELTVSLVDPSHPLHIHVDETLAEAAARYTDGFVVYERPGFTMVGSTAASWAARYEAQAAGGRAFQVCSTVN